jgi:hypothetical protein
LLSPGVGEFKTLWLSSILISENRHTVGQALPTIGSSSALRSERIWVFIGSSFITCPSNMTEPPLIGPFAAFYFRGSSNRIDFEQYAL